MITETYKDISPEIVSAMKPLIKKEDSYHHGHARRMARTLQVILDQKPQGKFLEVGTTTLIPLVLSKLAPDLDLLILILTNQNLAKMFLHFKMNLYILKLPELILKMNPFLLKTTLLTLSCFQKLLSIWKLIQCICSQRLIVSLKLVAHSL